MVIFIVMLKVIIFALCLGAVVSILILVPTFIYTIPYTLWVGHENLVGRQKDKCKESIFSAAKNATKLYKSWITRQKPTI
ncbi:hypothetical protein LY28_02765 [Ruminiclostridium sufflavum DSM 19573]|uniref:Uncharacterized protein n=1 Tax=Ruminiclostridium sufflavum DSM 19573 TaxID=1121337 RepID=A0A318XM47_9FIRM|nr:hypothetical protein [Ruminiclostridium sufflavum]PYG86739.1 hypothetical protein LY28_02765 [Ruminiclostridium sufflavum DSM 19573]